MLDVASVSDVLKSLRRFAIMAEMVALEELLAWLKEVLQLLQRLLMVMWMQLRKMLPDLLFYYAYYVIFVVLVL